jgi:hypothetical protein
VKRTSERVQQEFSSLPRSWHQMRMRRADKTPLKFVILMACLVLPFADVVIRTLPALAGD